MKIDAKIQARQWILNAIQNHSCIPNKETEREIRRFVSRLQRDITSMTKARETLARNEPKYRRARKERRELEVRFEHAIRGD